MICYGLTRLGGWLFTVPYPHNERELGREKKKGLLVEIKNLIGQKRKRNNNYNNSNNNMYKAGDAHSNCSLPAD